MICAHCRKPLETRTRRAKYCSTACRVAACRKRVQAIRDVEFFAKRGEDAVHQLATYAQLRTDAGFKARTKLRALYRELAALLNEA